MFFGTLLLNTVHFDFQLVRDLGLQLVLFLGVESTAARDSLQICRRHFFLDGGQHMDFGVRQWSKFGENRKTRNGTNHRQPPTKRVQFTCGQLKLQLPTKQQQHLK